MPTDASYSDVLEHQDPVNRCMGRAGPSTPFRQLQHPVNARPADAERLAMQPYPGAHLAWGRAPGRATVRVAVTDACRSVSGLEAPWIEARMRVLTRWRTNSRYREVLAYITCISGNGQWAPVAERRLHSRLKAKRSAP
jgi:hypothetical protein